MQKKLNINTVLKVITQELPKKESRNVFEKIMAGYFYEKKSRIFEEYREVLEQKNRLCKEFFFTDIYEIYYIFINNNYENELSFKTYYIRESDIKNFKKEAYKRIKAKNKNIFLLSDERLEKMLEIRKEESLLNDYKNEAINEKVLEKFEKNKKILTRIIKSKYVVDVKSFILFSLNEKFSNKEFTLEQLKEKK